MRTKESCLKYLVKESMRAVDNERDRITFKI